MRQGPLGRRPAACLAAALRAGSTSRGPGERQADLDAILIAPRRRLRAMDPSVDLSRRLAAYADVTADRRAWLADRLRDAARYLAPDGKPPRRGARAVAWRAVIRTAARLHAGRVRRLPTRSFLDAARLDALRREARDRQRRGRARRQQHAGPGPVLRRLAVDRVLRREASRALGFPVAPAFLALYIYDPPRSHVPPHLDRAPYDIIVHVVLEHHDPPRAGGSSLIVHRPRRDVRLSLGPGDAVVLCGRGAVHQWEPLGGRERRTLVGIGFRRLPRDIS